MVLRAFIESVCVGTAAMAMLAGCDNGAGGGGGGTTTGSTNPTTSTVTSTGTSPATTSGTASTSTGSPAGSSSGNPGGPFVDNGFVMAGSWEGYGFTVADTLNEGTTVTPSCSGGTCTPAFTGDTFCFSGSVAPDVGYAGFALLGWNLNQTSAAGSTPGAWAVPASGGVTITVTNAMDAPMRLQVQEPNATSNTQRYCAPLTSGQEIKWSDLVTECYATTGNTPLAAGTMLVNAAVQVYGGNMAAVPFNICITGMTLE